MTLIAVATAFILFVACSGPETVAIAPPPASPQEDVQSTIVLEAVASVSISARESIGTQVLGEVVVTPKNVVADLEEVIMMTADAFLVDGVPTSEVDLVWSMTDLRAGAIQHTGKFTASRVAGEYPDAISVTAVQTTDGGVIHVTASIPVTVVGEIQQAKLAEIVILPTEAAVLIGQLYRFRAIGYDEFGLAIPGVSYEWSVNDKAIGELNSIGYLSVSSAVGKYIDGVTVIGRWNDMEKAKSVDVTVLDVPDWDEILTIQVLPQRFHIDHGDDMQLRAVAINGLGELVAGTEIRWSMKEPVAGSVSGSGLFVAGADPGVFTEAVKVEAIIPGENGVIHAVNFASVIVRGDREKRRLDTVIARPEVVKLYAGGRTILSARALDVEGRPADNVAVIWDVVADGVGEIDQFGSFRASDTAGIYNSAVRATVTQELDGELITKTAIVDIMITGTLTDVVVEPNLATVVEGETVHYRAMGFDENGLTISGLLVRWRLTNPDLGRIDPLGNFTASTLQGLYTDAIVATVIQALTD